MKFRQFAQKGVLSDVMGSYKALRKVRREPSVTRSNRKFAVFFHKNDILNLDKIY